MIVHAVPISAIPRKTQNEFEKEMEKEKFDFRTVYQISATRVSLKRQIVDEEKGEERIGKGEGCGNRIREVREVLWVYLPPEGGREREREREK